jgi:hypothetical protein
MYVVLSVPYSAWVCVALLGIVGKSVICDLVCMWVVLEKLSTNNLGVINLSVVPVPALTSACVIATGVCNKSA